MTSTTLAATMVGTIPPTFEEAEEQTFYDALSTPVDEYPASSSSFPLAQLPRDVWVDLILGQHLRAKDVQAFLSSLQQNDGETASCSNGTTGQETNQDPTQILLESLTSHAQDYSYCPRHGTQQEPTAALQRLTRRPQEYYCSFISEEEDATTASTTTASTASSSHHHHNNHNHCPKCWQEEYHLERCHECKAFYPTTQLVQESANVLQCQCCQAMVYCQECLSQQRNHHASRDDGQGDGAGDSSNANSSNTPRNKCTAGCCPSPWTNTLCGDYLCQDCCSSGTTTTHDRWRTELETNTESLLSCHVCQKTTCLDPHCLVCDNHRLLHQILDNGNNHHHSQSSSFSRQHGATLALAAAVALYFWQ